MNQMSLPIPIMKREELEKSLPAISPQTSNFSPHSKPTSFFKLPNDLELPEKYMAPPPLPPKYIQSKKKN